MRVSVLCMYVCFEILKEELKYVVFQYKIK